VSPRRADRDPLTISAINALPIAGPPLRQEIARDKEKGITLASSPAIADEKTCPSCGGSAKIKILNYWCDPVTDIITPADTVEECDCGWIGSVVEHERPL